VTRAYVQMKRHLIHPPPSHFLGNSDQGLQLVSSKVLLEISHSIAAVPCHLQVLDPAPDPGLLNHPTRLSPDYDSKLKSEVKRRRK